MFPFKKCNLLSGFLVQGLQRLTGPKTRSFIHSFFRCNYSFMSLLHRRFNNTAVEVSRTWMNICNQRFMWIWLHISHTMISMVTIANLCLERKPQDEKSHGNYCWRKELLLIADEKKMCWWSYWAPLDRLHSRAWKLQTSAAKLFVDLRRSVGYLQHIW